MKIIKKRGISPIVATVLLIVISIIAIGLIVGVIFPLVRDNLAEGKSCFELREYFKILDSDYTCYNSSETRLMVERSMEDFEVRGFVISIRAGGISKRYDVYDGATGMKMLEGDNFVDNVKIPKPGEARTYLFDTGNGQGADIAVLQINGKICESEFYKIPVCSS